MTQSLGDEVAMSETFHQCHLQIFDINTLPNKCGSKLRLFFGGLIVLIFFA